MIIRSLVSFVLLGLFLDDGFYGLTCLGNITEHIELIHLLVDQFHLLPGDNGLLEVLERDELPALLS